MKYINLKSLILFKNFKVNNCLFNSYLSRYLVPT